MRATLLDRFFPKIHFKPGCWEWLASQNGVGYGVLSVNRNGGKILAHRLAYEYWKGPIPAGLVIDHLCRNAACVNPDHLEAVTQRVNTLRGGSPSAHQARRTHCSAGHPYDDANTYRYGGHRLCRACHRQHERHRYRLKHGLPLEDGEA